MINGNVSYREVSLKMATITKLTQEEKMIKLGEVIDKYRGQGRKALMQLLQEAQAVYGYLPLEVQRLVADALDLSVAEVYGVITFYSFFSLTPKGDYQISVCMGTACYVKGAQAVLDQVSAELGIETGECTPDGKFSIHACRCVGACGLAPVMMINENVYGNLSPDDVPGILASYKEE